MIKIDPTDEELLSYLMGDCESQISEKIKLQLKDDSGLRKRLEAMAFIKGEIKNTPIAYKLNDKRIFSLRLLSKQFVLSSFVFMMGLFIQSNFKILPKMNMEVQHFDISVSAPLSWDDSKYSTLM